MTATWNPQPDALGFTAADLHALPHDGLRYELIDGSIIVVAHGVRDTLIKRDLYARAGKV